MRPTATLKELQSSRVKVSKFRNSRSQERNNYRRKNTSEQRFVESEWGSGAGKGFVVR